VNTNRLAHLLVLASAAGVFAGPPAPAGRVAPPAQVQADKFIKIYLPSGQSITAEIAVTEAERARGLMFREKLLPDQGMLFVFEKEGTHAFWMKNTLIPLDMLWLDRDRRVVHIERNVPPCKADPCPSYGPVRPGLYVLELAAGAADRFGLKPADRLDFALPKR
jgi:uncharacterized membrane protein (UPF0127 family)